MLSGFLRRLFTRCPPAGRQLGLLREHEAIAERHTRVRAAWAPHLAECRKVVLETAARCPQRRRALVIGAGDCLDVPVAELAERFDEVVLADIVLSAEVRRWVRKMPGRVRGEVWDASGALAALAAVRETVTATVAPDFFARADPGPPPGGLADFIVSANCISQLGLVPGHSLPAYEQDTGLPERCARAAAKRHLAWLAQQPGVRLLLADAARLDLGPDGRQLKKETLHERFGLPKPDRTWRWDLAPIPEWSPDFHRVHEVGAWVWPEHPDGTRAGALSGLPG
ncbi:hypothetical protein Verru16b_00706 [Lacunisphaera limnophila]|uniref:Leucine carboxyl methyltransferase n=1 Tax=Lacunisphaera limnophila TaxID=1838286 RepID=A0A1D8ARY1_9BACT|nr:hypothetical protein [Lacunisphaera limnophila]AOS43654.1 hypothetical protein Verru16b_00706 [Lacunisphaera limnophila]